MVLVTMTKYFTESNAPEGNAFFTDDRVDSNVVSY